MSELVNISDFSPHLFWDVKPGTLDLSKHQRLITERVVQRGSRNDWRLLEKAYSREQIIAHVKKIDWLSEKDMAFVHVYFGIPYVEMKCYTKKQSAHYC